MRSATLAGLIIAASTLPAAGWAQSADTADNGTDPTKVSRQFVASWEHLALRDGFVNDQLKFSLTLPFGAKDDYSVRLRVPISSVDVLGNDGYALGDVSITVGHVFGLTREGGWVAQGELVLDTAHRPELGTGKTVLKGTLIRAWFLDNGSIFAPAVVHSQSLSGDRHRADVRQTTVDFYYVPKMADPRNLVTYDPSLNCEWVGGTCFVGLAITLGRVVGPAFGGNSIAYVKPSVFGGSDRPTDWGVEVGFKLIGF